MKIIKRIAAGVLSIVVIGMLLFVGKTRMTHRVTVDSSSWNTNYKNVFVHGLSGWGSYDKTNQFVRYWGMFSGDTLKSLNKSGFDCYSASVSPEGSAWDRACELYAQLTGRVTDYGKAHSTEHNHERFGTDFTEKPLISEWDSEHKINLLGHSFGGATIRLLSDLMEDGSESERQATSEEEISELFTGGKGDWIYSITALAAPHNGTSVYEALDAEDAGKAEDDEDNAADGIDHAGYDLHIDHAMELNESMQTQEDVYYFSYPCNATEKQADGQFVPDASITEKMFRERSTLIGKFTGTTENGFVIDEAWFPNDGLVNMISAKAPLNAPAKEYDSENVCRGEWNIMPAVKGDHMSLMGGMWKSVDRSQFYADHLEMINRLS